jgi:chaperonin cofactor prefoldin
MEITQWLGLFVTVATIITITATGVRWLVKHYFEEIKKELKPNSGSSLKDQVTRLESQHRSLEEKVDKIFDTILDFLSKK